MFAVALICVLVCAVRSSCSGKYTRIDAFADIVMLCFAFRKNAAKGSVVWRGFPPLCTVRIAVARAVVAAGAAAGAVAAAAASGKNT